MSAALPGVSWSPARKVAALVFGLVGYAALICVAMYLSGVLFLLLNKANPAQARLASVVRYWQLYADVPPLRKKLQLAIGVPAGALLVALPLAMLLSGRRPRSLHGDARFATAAEVQRSGLLSGSGPGILVGRHKRRHLYLRGQLSVMVAAPTRSGKGVGVVIPNLLNWRHSVVVLDIKGENFQLTAGHREARGSQVFSFSPFNDDYRTHRWNPLSSVRAEPLERVADLTAIGEVLYPNDSAERALDGFFNDLARSMFVGLGLLLFETPGLPRTIGEMLRQASGKGRHVAEHLRDLIDKRAESKEPLGPDCVAALKRLLSEGANTQASVVATFNAPLLVFADPMVDAATSGDDFSLEDLRRHPMSVYVRVPPHRLASARQLLNLFFSQVVNLNTRQLPDHTLRYQCLLVNDEFSAMGRATAISRAVGYMSAYNLRLLTVVQAMSQLDAVYGVAEARTFATNHALQILFAPREQRDAEDYSAMLGYYTQRATSRGRSRSVHGHSGSSSTESDQRRALLMPQEIKQLGAAQEVIVMENCLPILCRKVVFHKEPVFMTLLRAPPGIPVLDVAAHHASVHKSSREVGDDAKDASKELLRTVPEPRGGGPGGDGRGDRDEQANQDRSPPRR